jgi:acyl dehydratase
VSFDIAAIGTPGEELAYEVTEAAMLAYAQATDDAPGGPVFPIVPVWRTIAPASRAVAPGDVRRFIVHYEQDVVLHRAIVPGTTLLSRATPVALLARPNGTSLVIKTETRDGDGELVNEQYVTEFFRGVTADESVGERAPDHRLEVAGEPAFAEVTYAVADDQTLRYAAASGDDFAIHLDDEFARGVGLPGRIVHGLCTMAFAGRAVLQAAGVQDPRTVKRIAVRFSAPLFPGDAVTTRVWEVGGAFGFESVNSEGRPVLKDGRLELQRVRKLAANMAHRGRSERRSAPLDEVAQNRARGNASVEGDVPDLRP